MLNLQKLLGVSNDFRNTFQYLCDAKLQFWNRLLTDKEAFYCKPIRLWRFIFLKKLNKYITQIRHGSFSTSAKNTANIAEQS